MPLQIIRQDITKFHCDAIVNAANETLLGGGGVDGAIHRAAGPELLEECRTLGGCRTGQSKITKGYRLPCKYIIHTVGPVWRGGGYGERELLESCYRTALNLAAEYQCESAAFPLISSGIFGYPKADALRTAVDTIAAFLTDHDMTVYLVIFDRAGYQISERLFSGVQSYIDDHYAAEHADAAREYARRRGLLEQLSGGLHRISGRYQGPPKAGEAALPVEDAVHMAAAPSLDEMLGQIDESFSQMLLRKIDERGMTDAQCYKRANIDRKLFSKIRSNVHYRPRKATALAFAIALELPLEETKEMLMKAGYALSHSNRFDIIIEYFILSGNYNIYEINETLFAFDQSLLGG